MLRALEPNPILLRAFQDPTRADQRERYSLPVAVDPFSEAEIRYKTLVDERRTGDLPPRAFRLAVRDLAVLDSEGRRWMLGPEDGIWYRRENERWLQADPPRRLVCSSCGHHNLGRHSFCVECGQRLNRPA
jgi:hypothetical protein